MCVQPGNSVIDNGEVNIYGIGVQPLKYQQMMTRIKWMPMAILCAVFLSFSGAIPVSHAQEESAAAGSLFEDKALEDAVRKYVFEKRNNSEPLTKEELSNISTIKAKDQGITSLKGLEHCINLASFDAPGNSIADLSPLAGMKRLQFLDVADNNISDISTLATLKGLQYVDLSKNSVSDLSPLSHCTAITALYLSDNAISDITPILTLPKVWSLYLDGNDLQDLIGIYRMKRLTTLSVRNNNIRDLSPIFGLNQLNNLFFDFNEITDLGSLINIVEADRNGPREFSMFLNVSMEGNPLTFEARRNQVPQLEKLIRKIYKK